MRNIWQRGWFNDEHIGYWVIQNVHGFYFRRGGMETGNPELATGYLEQDHAVAACRLKNKQEKFAEWLPVKIEDAVEAYEDELKGHSDL
jgi:hypothetical protein